MLSRGAAVVLTLAAAISCCSSSSALRQIGARNGDFALNLYKELQQSNDNNDNIIFSPFSISAALAMTMLGARGNTLSEMSVALQYQGVDNVHAQLQTLLRHLTLEVSSDVRVANRLYNDEDFAVLQAFQDGTEEHYSAGIQQVDFAERHEDARLMINSWVANQTENMIQDLIPEGVLNPNVVLVLVNAVYFNGSWATHFETSATRTGRFYNGDHYVETDMMVAWQDFGYYRSDDLRSEIVELPYENDDVSMFIILPYENTNVSYLEEHITGDLLRRALGETAPQYMDLKMPKFQATQSFLLKDALEGLGMTDLFTQQADLSGIGEGDLTVSSVLHKAFIEVSESGTQAAAATSVVEDLSLPLNPDLIVTVNRPFMFVICDTTSLSPLFQGRIIDPLDGGQWNVCESDCPPPGSPYDGELRSTGVTSTRSLLTVSMVLMSAMMSALYVEL